MKVFIDIDIGDTKLWKEKQAAFNVSNDFYKQSGCQYGLTGNLGGLNTESKEILREAFVSDPNWAAKVGIPYLKLSHMLPALYMLTSFPCRRISEQIHHILSERDGSSFSYLTKR